MHNKITEIQKHVEEFILRAANACVSMGIDSEATADRIDGCLLLDLSTDGAAVLAPSALCLPSGLVKLHVPSPAVAHISDVLITAEVRWMNDQRSTGHAMLGMQFHEPGESDIYTIRNLMQWIRAGDDCRLACSVVPVLKG